MAKKTWEITSSLSGAQHFSRSLLLACHVILSPVARNLKSESWLVNKEKRQNNPLSSDHFWLPQWQFYTRCKSIVVNASVIFYSSSLSQVFLRCSIHPSRISYLSTKYSKIELSQAKVVVLLCVFGTSRPTFGYTGKSDFNRASL